jgi:hypothetical protein
MVASRESIPSESPQKLKLFPNFNKKRQTLKIDTNSLTGKIPLGVGNLV